MYNNIWEEYPYRHPSTARECARIVPPLFLFLWFLIAGSFVLVYNLAEYEAVPRNFMDGLGISFAVLFGVWCCCLGGLWMTKKKKKKCDMLIGEREDENLDWEEKGSVIPGKEKIQLFMKRSEWSADDNSDDEETGDYLERLSSSPRLNPPLFPPDPYRTAKQLDADISLGFLMSSAIVSHESILPEPAKRSNDELLPPPLPPFEEQQARYFVIDHSGNSQDVQCSHMCQRQRSRTTRPKQTVHHGGISKNTARSKKTMGQERLSMLFKNKDLQEFQELLSFTKGAGFRRLSTQKKPTTFNHPSPFDEPLRETTLQVEKSTREMIDPEVYFYRSKFRRFSPRLGRSGVNYKENRKISFAGDFKLVIRSKAATGDDVIPSQGSIARTEELTSEPINQKAMGGLVLSPNTLISSQEGEILQFKTNDPELSVSVSAAGELLNLQSSSEILPRRKAGMKYRERHSSLGLVCKLPAMLPKENQILYPTVFVPPEKRLGTMKEREVPATPSISPDEERRISSKLSLLSVQIPVALQGQEHSISLVLAEEEGQTQPGEERTARGEEKKEYGESPGQKQIHPNPKTKVPERKPSSVSAYLNTSAGQGGLASILLDPSDRSWDFLVTHPNWLEDHLRMDIKRAPMDLRSRGGVSGMFDRTGKGMGIGRSDK